MGSFESVYILSPRRWTLGKMGSSFEILIRHGTA
jgi:hypothetical protein